jgi:hypothetical protein
VAGAPGHKLGQMIGDFLEEAFRPPLSDFCKTHGLFLDYEHVRKARSGVKCTWQDSLGNKHDLDFVIERAGTEEKLGLPAAFIELAWRRYTKHSKAKAQEIQGAIIPLLNTYSQLKPFAGAIVAGDWTTNALNQMRSSGFTVLHLSYPDLVEVFGQFDVDIDTDEHTPDEFLGEQVAKAEALSRTEIAALTKALRDKAADQLVAFLDKLENVMGRSVVEVIVLMLYGKPISFANIGEAMAAISHMELSSSKDLRRVEVQLRYNNGDEVRASFQKPEGAAEFLRTFGG